MPPDKKKLFMDIQKAANSIVAFVKDTSYEEFKKSELTQSAVCYQFAIVGEALSQLRSIDETLAEQVSEYMRIIGFRNQLVHGYSRIDPEITWRIIQFKLPILFRTKSRQFWRDIKSYHPSIFFQRLSWTASCLMPPAPWLW